MGTGWRRAFCTTIPRDRETKVVVVVDNNRHQQQEALSSQRCKSQGPSPSPSPSPRSISKLGFFSNPTTPRMHKLNTKTSSNNNNNTDALISPRLHCKTTTNITKTNRNKPSSPRSPFSILKNTLRSTKSGCGVCMQSVKTGQGMAIYTAECSHSFHFPCIASHVKKHGNLVCPVCNSTWKDVPLLANYRRQQQQDQEPQQVQEKEIIVDENATKQDPTPVTPRHHRPSLSNVRTNHYGDDEPLLTPKCSTISEANEEFEGGDDEEIEEFKGFFVNPISSDGKGAARGGRNVEVSLFPEAALISIGQTHETYAVVLKIKAPPPIPVAQNSLDPAQRAPIDLVTVLDVSESMSGAKLQMLKRAMRLVISSLGSADRLSIVCFSAVPKRLMPLRRMTSQGQRAARRLIDRLVCSQGTSVGEALKKASKVLEDRRERNPVASIMLLSDGHDESVQSSNNSQRKGSSSQASSTRFSHVEIPVQSSGLGGNSSYKQEPAEDAFTKCVGGLLCVVVQDLRVQLGFAYGSDPAEVSAAYLSNGRPMVLNGSSFRLGDFYAEEEREVLLELRVPKSAFGSHHVLSVQCCYKDPATQELVFGSEQALLVPRLQAVRSSSPRVERLRSIFITTRAIAESRRLMEHNELTSAMQLLTSARALLLQSSQTSTEEYIKGLEAELSDVQWRRHYQHQMEQQQMMQRRRTNDREESLFVDENGEPLTPSSAWRAAEKLAKVVQMKKSMNRVTDLHGFDNARF